jgi:integrase/recombinase XerC
MTITVAQAVENFLKACRTDGLKGVTVRGYEGKLRPFLDVYGAYAFDAVTTGDMRDYLDTLYGRTVRYVGVKKKKPVPGGLSIESIRGHIRILKRFWRWCVETYDINPRLNPMRGIKTPRAPKPVPKAAEPSTVWALLRGCDQTPEGRRMCAFIAFLADTGCRLQGALGLRLQDLDLTAGRAVLLEKYDKGRIVPFGAFTTARLREWLALRPVCNTDRVFVALGTNTYGVPMTISGVHKALNRLAIEAGVAGKRKNPQSLRHGLAHMWLDAGGDANRLAEVMGHSDVAITLRVYAAYLHNQALEKHADLALIDTLMKGGES